MSSVSLPHRVHLLEQQLMDLDREYKSLRASMSGVTGAMKGSDIDAGETATERRVKDLENKYRMLNARLSRKA